MAQYSEIGSDGKVRIVRVDPNGDKSRRKLIERQVKKTNKPKKD